jgi:hypothetical protein
VPVPQQMSQIPILPARHPGLPGNDPAAASAGSVARPGDPSSACVLAFPRPRDALTVFPWNELEKRNSELRELSGRLLESQMWMGDR